MVVLPRQPTPLDRPLPLRFIFPLLFVGVYLAHLTLLRLPYYWDEAGYYIPAAYDFFRTGDVIPSTTLANAHPPLPSLYLALWWKSGFTPAVTRTAMCLITAIALLAVYRLAILLNGRPWVAATHHCADRNLPRLVCPEYAGARRYVRRRRNPVGAGLRLCRPTTEAPECYGRQQPALP